MLHFETFDIECVTNSTDEKPEDAFKIRDINNNFGHLILLRSTLPQKFYLMLCRKKPVQKKVLQSIIFSNFNNIDYISIHHNTCPEIFKKLFDNGLKLGDNQFSIVSVSYLLEKIHTRFLKDKNDLDELNQPYLNYFRFKLECMLLMSCNQKLNRPEFVCGKSDINFGEALTITGE